MLARRPIGFTMFLLMVVAAVGGLLAVAGGANAGDRGSAGDSPRVKGPSAGSGIECSTKRGWRTTWCERGSLLGGDGRFAISPDGLSAYEVPYPPEDERSVLEVYDRDPATGSVVQKDGTAGCIAERPRRGCQTGRGLRFAYEAAVSPDGRNVYVSSGGKLAIFDRDPATGELTQKAGREGCINLSPKSGAPTCANVPSLSGIFGLAISPDGGQIYAATSRALVWFNRDPDTGGLSLAPEQIRGAAQSEVVVSPDGVNLYVLTERGVPEQRPRSLLKTFVRDPATGGLTRVPGRAGCISEKGLGGCRYGRAMFGGYLIISPDGRNLYAANGIYHIGNLLTFDRLPDGTLAQKPGRAGCIYAREEGEDEGCAPTYGIGSPRNLGIGRDGETVFVEELYDPFVPTLFTRHPSGRLTPVDR